MSSDCEADYLTIISTNHYFKVHFSWPLSFSNFS